MKDEFINEYMSEELDSQYRTYAWKTAIGLQTVEGLEPSENLIRIAAQNINGDISFDKAHELISEYYDENEDESLEEADEVSVSIAEILCERAFAFSPIELMTIHKRLFENIYEGAGEIRDYNFTDGEWVLDGDSVIYANALNLRENLDYLFATERSVDYSTLSDEAAIKHVAGFIADLWQINAFDEGNTRATAVFLIKYLTKLGFNVTNDVFAENSWYFKNALVRANYSNREKGIIATTNYLELFLRNLILGEHNALSNKEMHISSKEAPGTVSSPEDREAAILDIIRANPAVTLDEVAMRIGKSTRTVKTAVKLMQEQGILERVGGKKLGSWRVNK